MVGAGLAFIAGAAVAWLNDCISRAAFKRSPSLLLSLSVVRQMISVLYLVALYFLSRVLPWGLAPLLIGGGLGVTLPSILFACRLARKNDAERAEAARKGLDEEDDLDG